MPFTLDLGCISKIQISVPKLKFSDVDRSDGRQRVVGQHQASVQCPLSAEFSNLGRSPHGRIPRRHQLLGHLRLRQELPHVPHRQDCHQEVPVEDV